MRLVVEHMAVGEPRVEVAVGGPRGEEGVGVGALDAAARLACVEAAAAFLQFCRASSGLPWLWYVSPML